MTAESQKYLALGVMWLLILIGFGTCQYLTPDRPIIQYCDKELKP